MLEGNIRQARAEVRGGGEVYAVIYTSIGAHILSDLVVRRHRPRKAGLRIRYLGCAWHKICSRAVVQLIGVAAQTARRLILEVGGEMFMLDANPGVEKPVVELPTIAEE